MSVATAPATRATPVSIRHPLEPLQRPGSPAGGRAAQVAGQGHADHALRLRQPQGAAEGPRPRLQRQARRSRARRSPCCSTTPPTPATRRRSRSTDRQAAVVEARPRRAADDDDRRADRVRAGRAGQPGVQGRAQEAVRHRRHQPGDGRYLERRQLRRRGGPHAAAGPAALLPAHATRPTTATCGRSRAAAGRRSQHDAGDPRRGVRPLAAAAGRVQLRRRPRAEVRAATSSRWRSPSRRGRASRSRATRCAGRTGASSSASTPAKG